VQFWAAEGTQTEQKQRRGTERGDRDWRERRIDSKNSSYPAVLVSDLNWHRTWQDEYLQTSCGHDASIEYCRAAFEDTHHQIVCW
jgi:hypothetical protein